MPGRAARSTDPPPECVRLRQTLSPPARYDPTATWCDGDMTSPSVRDHEAAVELERFAIELASGAADVIRAHGRAGLTVSAKSTSTDLVTEVDRNTERWLVEQIARARPHDGILG